MKYAVQMGSGAMICIPSFVNYGLGIQKLIVGTHWHTDRMVCAVSIIIFGLRRLQVANIGRHVII
jgi:hypothetical protein